MMAHAFLEAEYHKYDHPVKDFVQKKKKSFEISL